MDLVTVPELNADTVRSTRHRSQTATAIAESAQFSC
jgi:hypothetical protein